MVHDAQSLGAACKAQCSIWRLPASTHVTLLQRSDNGVKLEGASFISPEAPMGVSVSRAQEGPPVAVRGGNSGSLLPPAAAAVIQNVQSGTVAVEKPVEAIDYMHLPPPIKYEELQRESMMTLKPELFEGLRFDFTKPLNQNFALCHSIFMGNIDVPTQNNQPLKMPMGTYEFGANLVSSTGNMMIGRIMTDGRMSGRVKYDFYPWLGFKLQMNLAPEAGVSQGMVDFDVKGGDWNAQLKLGNSEFVGLNYLQSVTPKLALGGEAFWLGQQRKSGAGFAARHADDKHVATAQVATTGLVSLTYLRRISEKVSLASEFLWNWNSREASAAFGYDYVLRQCRLRGRVDTDGKVAAYLEERVNVGVNFILSAEIDHWKKDYKFGFGMTVGE